MEEDFITSIRFMGAVSMLLMALVLSFVNRSKGRSGVYERSRWMIVVGCLLLSAHMATQFFGHFREYSPTLSWSINLIYYTPILPLFYLGSLNLIRGGLNMKWPIIRCMVYAAISYILFIVGYATDTLINDAAPWHTTTILVAAVLSAVTIDMMILLLREVKKFDSRLTDIELAERHRELRLAARTTKFILFFAMLIPWIGISSNLELHSVVGFVMICLLLWHFSRFYMYGNDIFEVTEVNEEICEASLAEEEFESPVVVNEEERNAKQRIEQWIKERHYTDPNLTIAMALEQMGVSLSTLNFYLEHNANVGNYRKWLPYLRIEEAKRVMQEHPEYSLQAVAEESGYSNNSSMARAFRMQEGLTPSEWLQKKRKE